MTDNTMFVVGVVLVFVVIGVLHTATKLQEKDNKRKDVWDWVNPKRQRIADGRKRVVVFLHELFGYERH